MSHSTSVAPSAGNVMVSSVRGAPFDLHTYASVFKGFEVIVLLVFLDPWDSWKISSTIPSQPNKVARFHDSQPGGTGLLGIQLEDNRRWSLLLGESNRPKMRLWRLVQLSFRSEEGKKALLPDCSETRLFENCYSILPLILPLSYDRPPFLRLSAAYSRHSSKFRRGNTGSVSALSIRAPRFYLIGPAPVRTPALDGCKCRIFFPDIGNKTPSPHAVLNGATKAQLLFFVYLNNFSMLAPI